MSAANEASMTDTQDPKHWDLVTIVTGLAEAREAWRKRRSREQDRGDREFPSVDRVAEAMRLLRGALFPLRLGPSDLQRDGEDFYVGHALDRALNALLEEARLELSNRRLGHSERPPDQARAEARERITAFAHTLPNLRRLLDEDVEAAYAGDPAARSMDEVLLCYPGILALIHHRIAHELYRLDLPLLARIIAELAHSETGIDIHPGATIGHHFFIDHGTGVVIGETAEIGDNVRLYQAVTLGAKRFEVQEDGALAKGQPRHPIVEDDVVIYAGATVLGRVTIGRGSTIGGNVWLTRSVPPGSQITQARSEQQDAAD
ncbi:MAG: serine acetyltransferase [Gammaproteobacteria bacterium]|nr:serine acetyltransferase [Gammaproteobacteria bacterium]